MNAEEHPSISVKAIQPTGTGGHAEVLLMCQPGDIEIPITLQMTVPEDGREELHPHQWAIVADQLLAWRTIAMNQGDSSSTHSLWPHHALRVQLNEPTEDGPQRAHLVLLPTQTRIDLLVYADHQYDGGLYVPPHVWTQLERQFGDWYTCARDKSERNSEGNQPRAGFL